MYFPHFRTPYFEVFPLLSAFCKFISLMEKMILNYRFCYKFFFKFLGRFLQFVLWQRFGFAFITPSWIHIVYLSAFVRLFFSIEVPFSRLRIFPSYSLEWLLCNWTIIGYLFLINWAWEPHLANFGDLLHLFNVLQQVE